MPLKNDWQNGDLFTPAAANEMANVVNAYGPPTATGQSLVTAANAAAARAALGVADVFNVKSYGAVGDGVTDDRAAIHAARDAAGAGGTVFFPNGTYLVEMVGSATPFGSGGLHANVAGQTWMLGSAELVLTGSAQENLITISAPNVSIVGGTLDLSGIADNDYWNSAIAVWSGTVLTGVYGAHGSGAAGAVIRDVTINDAPSYGIHVVSTNSVSITGCTITNFYQVGIMVQTDITETDDVYDFLIHGNRLESDSASFAAALYVGANDQAAANFDTAVARVRRARVTGNSCVIPREYVPGGLEAGAIQMFNAEDCVIDGNVTDGGAMGITTGFLRRTAISNNTCRGWRSIGIEVSGGLDHVNVIGNVLDSDGAGGPFDATTGLPDAGGASGQSIYGILSSGEKSFTNYTVAGNTISGFTTSARGNGVLLYNSLRPSAGATFDSVTISGNAITAGGGSARFYGLSVYAPTTNLTMCGNLMDGSSRTDSAGISIAESTHDGMSLTGNNFSNFVVAAASLSGTFTDARFTGNVIRNCGTAITGTGVASATRLVVDDTSPTTSTATAAGTTTLTVDSAEVQLFTGTTTQTVKLPTTNVLAGRRFTVINSSTGSVTVQSSNTNTVETVRAGTSANFVALQNTPTTNAHWQTSATGQINTGNRLQAYSGSSQTNLLAIGGDTDVSVNLYSKAGGNIRFRNDTGTTFFAGGPVASGVNWLTVNGSATGNAPYMIASGSDTNIDLNLRSKGTGVVQANGVAVSTNATTATHIAQQIELGHASDTTIARSAAGVVTIEGNTVATRLTNTATLDFGSVSAQSEASLTMTVTGAATGDAVALGVPTAAVTNGIDYTAWVSAADTVTVRASNYSAGSLDPASGTFRATIIR